MTCRKKSNITRLVDSTDPRGYGMSRSGVFHPSQIAPAASETSADSEPYAVHGWASGCSPALEKTHSDPPFSMFRVVRAGF
ncbi:hypothetical protein NUU61_000869 [Penicillium alfredii]|uniref:Uncharacterized protein n=1 Tax=Penicillium alfredii TaxID=1506179 RepID=A0A9W9KR37_9EURO|nr:uncharacterized protein NUU61_000869 [Penicillium alfredii]KAJ5115110.1 hypothetical protein NUU61_000869 [Penicillium alfredii]